MMEWQPIETAPKTGRSRLVWTPRYRNTYLVVWRDEGWEFFGGPGRLNELDQPTHWMPLPDPPS